MIIPQVCLYEEEETALSLRTRQRWELFLPLLVGTGLAISLQSAGATTAIVQTHHLAWELKRQAQSAMTSMTGSLEPLQQQINSLAGVVFQNRRALALITAEHGGLAWYWGKNATSKWRNQILSKQMSTPSKNFTKTCFEHLAGSLTPCLPGSYPFSPLIMLHCILTLATCLFSSGNRSQSLLKLLFPCCPYGNQTSY